MIDKMHKGVNYRTMTLEDIPAVIDLDRQIFPDPWPKDSYRYELVENKSSICLVAEIPALSNQSNLVGFIVVWLVIDEAHIGTLAVSRSYQHKGVGRQLLGLALLESLQYGAGKSLLEVRASNTSAQHLYLGMGYKIVGLRPGYYPDNHEDAFLLTLEKLDQVDLTSMISI